MTASKKVVVVGAGMAGLAAARTLCNAGFAVSVFEANSKVGGCCATTRVGDYTFNDGAVYLALPGMLDCLFGRLNLDRERVVPLRKIASIQSTRLPDGTLVDIRSGTDAEIRSSRSAADTARFQEEIQAFIDGWDPALRFFADDILVRPLSLPHLVVAGWRHLARLRGSAAAQLKRSFSSEAARAALGGALLYAGAAPDRQPAAAVLGLAAMLRDGYFLPEGGMGRIPGAIFDALRSQGGTIELETAVRRIKVKSGRVCAIELDRGDLIEVDAVISSVSAMHTYRALLSEHELPRRLVRRVVRAPLSHKGFVLQLGLADALAVRSYANYELPWLDEQFRIFQGRAGGLRWPIYMVPTQTLPEMAPEGGGVVEMYLSIDQSIAPDDWSEARKAELAAQAMELLRREQALEVEVSRVLSPKEFQNDTRLYAGALYGLSPNAGPAALFGHRTPIHGLYQAGQTTWPGFGVIGAGFSGLFAAEALMHDELR